MVKLSRIVKIVVMAVATVAGMAGAFPKPSPVPTDWELEIKFQDLKRISVKVPGQKAQVYWYMIYTVTNTTGQDVVFHPEFSLVTNTLQVLPAMVNVEPEVFNAVKREYKSTYPWLEHPSKVIGKLLQGKDNARDSVAIWPDFDPKASILDVFIGGLAGEIVAVPNPTFVPGKSDPKVTPERFVLRKTLQIRYALPTDPANRNRVSPARSAGDVAESGSDRGSNGQDTATSPGSQQSAVEWVMR